MARNASSRVCKSLASSKLQVTQITFSVVQAQSDSSKQSPSTDKVRFKICDLLHSFREDLCRGVHFPLVECPNADR